MRYAYHVVLGTRKEPRGAIGTYSTKSRAAEAGKRVYRRYIERWAVTAEHHLKIVKRGD